MYEDNSLSGRFAALAPEPFSGNWDEVLDRAGTARNGRQRLKRLRVLPGRRRRLVVVLAALALATALTAAVWAIVREFVLDKGFIGLPPAVATPSTPEGGELVIQYWVKGARAWVYADGRLIRLRENADLPEAANRWSSGLLEQRLTPEGVELLRSEIVSTGLFGHDQPPLGSNPPHSVIQVRIGDRLVRVAVSFLERRLLERLADPAAWLPASAWANRQIRAYVPSRYAILYGGLPQTIERSRILSLLPAPAEDLLRAHEAVPRLGYIGGLTKTSFTYYVSDLTTEEARALAQALDDAGLKQSSRRASWGTASRSQARASIHLCLRRASPKRGLHHVRALPPARREGLLAVWVVVAVTSRSLQRRIRPGAQKRRPGPQSRACGFRDKHAGAPHEPRATSAAERSPRRARS